jgi:hypothetical protein
LAVRAGRFMAKNAAETIRNVWMCRVFICTPFSNASIARYVLDVWSIPARNVLTAIRSQFAPQGRENGIRPPPHFRFPRRTSRYLGYRWKPAVKDSRRDSRRRVRKTRATPCNASFFGGMRRVFPSATIT